MGATVVAFLVVLGTAIWAAADWRSIEKKLQARRIPLATVSTVTPLLWLIMCLLLWIVFFPYYLFGPRRRAQRWLRIYDEERFRRSIQ